MALPQKLVQEFDALVTKYKGDKSDEAAQILMMEASLYSQVLRNEAKGKELMPDVVPGDFLKSVLGTLKNKIVANAVPLQTIRSVNKVLGANFVTRYGTQRGVLVLGKAAPFGVGFAIGAGGNLFMAKGVIKTAKTMFDAAEELNRADGDATGVP